MSAAAPVLVRDARPEEYPAVGRLTERAFAHGPYGHLPVSAARRELVHGVGVRAATGSVLVATGADGALLGTASVLRHDSPHARLARAGEAELRLLATAPEARGRGIARALALAAQEDALAWGADALVLDTSTLNHASQRLYARLGYREFRPAATGGAAPEASASTTGPDADGGIDHLDFRLPLQPRADVVVRLARPDEVEEIAALSLRAYEAAYELSAEYRASILDVGERIREHQVWVAADAAGGRLLGTVATPRRGRTISPLARDGELDFRLLAVDPPARGRGIGALLTRHAVELARLRGLDRVVMNSGEQMTGAHRLYERLGFARLPEREHDLVVDGGRRIRLFAFSLDVPAERGSIAA